MALSGTLSAAYRGWTYRIDWSATQSTADNTSEVTCVHKLICGSGYNLNIGSRSNSCTVGGVKKDFTSAAISTSGGTTHTLGTTKHLLTHNDDGSKSASVSGSFNIQATLSGTYKASIQVSGTITLNDIPRASQPSLVTWPETTNDVGDFGETFSIHMNRNADSFTHTVRYEFGTRKGNIATGVTTGTTWAVPLAWMSDIPAAVKASGRIYVDTYNGSKLIGTKYTGFTVTVPASVKPTCSIQVLDATDIKDTYGDLVKGYSKLRVKTTGTPAYSSPMAAYNVTANGQRFTAADITTAVLTAAGTTEVTATVTDKRGRTSSEASASFTVLDYAKPSITAMRVHRCNEDGVEDAQGEFVEVVFSAKITPLNNKNGAAYTLRYKKSKETTYTEIPLADLAGKYTVTNKSYIFAADSGNSYDIEVEAADDLSSATRTTSASTAFTLMHWGADGRSIGFGKIAETADTVEFGISADFQAPVYGMAYGLGALPSIPENADLNDYTRPGCYAVRQNVTAATIANIPVQTAGRLYVTAATGNGGDLDPNAKYVYREQRFVPFQYGQGARNAGAWIRYIERNNSLEWTVYPWFNEAIKAYPVGSIYIAYNHTDPATLFGGTWARIQNAFLWAVDSSGTIGQTGGEKTHALTVSELPAHNHGGTYTNAGTARTHAWLTSNGSSMGYDTVSAGSGAAHNNMPPYIQVSIWRRTA